jgi:hypothetical protein
VGDARSRLQHWTVGGLKLVDDHRHGLAPNGSILLVADEVGLDDRGAIEVSRRVQRYGASGEPVAEESFVVDQFVQISRTLEMTADGSVAHLVTRSDAVDVRILGV